MVSSLSILPESGVKEYIESFPEDNRHMCKIERESMVLIFSLWDSWNRDTAKQLLHLNTPKLGLHLQDGNKRKEQKKERKTERKTERK